MHVREITELAIKGGRIQTEGKTPWSTMRVQIQREIARQTELKLPPTFALDGPIVSLASGTRMPLEPDPELEGIAQKIDDLSTDDFEVLVEQVFRARQGGFIVTKTRRSGDGGIDVRGTVELPDGIQLSVGIQAKHHAPDKPKPTVGRPVIQALRGSLPPRAIGYVVTSGTFSRGAREDADRSDSIHPIRLIEGDELARLVRAAKVSFTREGRVAVPEV
jgi:restriction system protein